MHGRLAATLAAAVLAACSPLGVQADRATPDDACDEATRSAVDDVVADQLAAFADDRWEDALGLASAAFRDDFDPSRLATLIEGQFPVAAAAVDHDLGPCVTTDEQAQVLVSVVDERGDRLSLGYLLVMEDAGWRIAGAVPVGEREEESGPLV